MPKNKAPFAVFQKSADGATLTIRLQGAPRDRAHVAAFAEMLVTFFREDTHWEKSSPPPHLVFNMQRIQWLRAFPYLPKITESMRQAIPWMHKRVCSIAVLLPAKRGIAKAVSLFAKAFPTNDECPVYIGDSDEGMVKWQHALYVVCEVADGLDD